MTKESCTKVVDIGLRRLAITQENIATELTGAIAVLKDAESRLLRSHIAMEDADWDSGDELSKEALLKIREHAKHCQDSTEECHAILMRLCDELGYDDPFSTESSD